MDKTPTLVEVAVDAPVKRTLTYTAPKELTPGLEKGKRVLVPLARRKVTGYIVGLPDKTSLKESELKDIYEIIDPEPLFPPGMLPTLAWAAGYYLAPLSEVLKTALPGGINLASTKIAKITAPGRQELAREQGIKESKGRKKPAASRLALLELLAEKAELEIPKSNVIGGVELDPAMIRRMEKQGLIEISHEAGRPRVTQKTERVAAPAREVSKKELEKLSRRAPEQARLLAEVLVKGRVPLRLLKPGFKDPGGLARRLSQSGLVEIREEPVSRDPFSMELETGPVPEELMPEQQAAVSEICAAMDRGAFKTFLLHGVTGSGKTEVYIRAIEKAFNRGRGAIMLAPEISLTPQLISRFAGRFDRESLAVIHSGLSPGERFDEWRRIKKGQARIVIGARSAVFAPVQDPGIIVVDEEQEGSYKQDHGFMYNARDLSVMRAREQGAVAVLGSATPSMESSYRARQENGYSLITLKKRVDNRPMPEVEVVDMRKIPDPGRPAPPGHGVRDQDRVPAGLIFSESLKTQMQQALAREEQVILFFNRRGAASFMLCFDCGERLLCPNCAVSMVHHLAPTRQKVDRFYGEPAKGGYLLCHYCGAHVPVPEVCPSCRGVRLHRFGLGTERVERAVCELFPEARLMRMDSDAVSGKKGWFRCMDALSRRQVDVVVGTQMVAKGHDLPGVTLVGVLLADLGLNMPDFRASERTFQIITQAAGRAGRGASPGKVIIQTFQPEHFAVRMAAAGDFEGFYAEETRTRQALGYPPFARLVNVRLQGMDEKAVRRAASMLGRTTKQKAATKAFKQKVRILGPAPAPITRIKAKTRWMMLVKADSHATMGAFCRELLKKVEEKDLPSSVRVEFDRDPVSLL